MMKWEIRNIAFVSILFASSSSCDLTGMCDNEVIRNLNFNNKKAVVFYRDCGATTSASIQVSILNKDDILANNMVGNAFILGDSNGLKANDEAIEVKWISKDSLKVEYDKRLTTFLKKIKVSNTTILYSAK